MPHAPSEVVRAVAKNYAHVVVAGGQEIPIWLTSFVEAKSKFIGHNCNSFDGPFLRHHYGLAPEWYDTIHGARAAGLPGGLDALGKAFGISGKDEEGKKIMHLLCMGVIKHGEPWFNPGTPPLWSKLLAYNIQDVKLTELVYNECRGAEEPELVQADQEINDRGIYVDTEWLQRLLGLWDRLNAAGGDRLADLTHGVLTCENARSVKAVRGWLETQGLFLGSLNRKEVERFYEKPEDFLGGCDHPALPLIIEVLKLRQAMSRAMRGKLNTILETLDDDHRVRDWSVYYGAHTGRFTSRRVQLQNMASRIEPKDKNSRARLDIRSILNGPRTLDSIQQLTEEFDTDDVLAALTRPVFTAAPGMALAIVDYASVEARGVAWLANERWLLDAFNDPQRDVYCEFGSRIFGREITKKDKAQRDVAKICVLGMGYGMSGRKFSLYAKMAHVDLERFGLTAEGLVKQYRESCPAVVAMWREVGAQLECAAKHGHGIACGGRVRFDMVGGTLELTLPSGRPLRYRKCRIERGVPGFCTILGIPPFETDLVRYAVPRGYDVDLYGTKAVENIVQAFCRDFLTDALVTFRRIKDATVLHCHDEIVNEYPAECALPGLHRMGRIMSTPPAWAAGFPLRVEGFTSGRYVKSAWPGSIEVDYMNGVLIAQKEVK